MKFSSRFLVSGAGMVQCARHAVVEFSSDWAVRLYHCVICDFSSNSRDDFVSHASSHLIKNARTNFHTTASAEDGTELEHTNTFIIHEQGTVAKVSLQYTLSCHCGFLMREIQYVSMTSINSVFLPCYYEL